MYESLRSYLLCVVENLLFPTQETVSVVSCKRDSKVHTNSDSSLTNASSIRNSDTSRQDSSAPDTGRPIHTVVGPPQLPDPGNAPLSRDQQV
jgi:hypothetical protein